MDLSKRATVGSRKSPSGITGTPGSDKATLVEQLIAHLVYDGRHVASTKHTHHGFDLDSPGKDLRRMHEAGNAEVVLMGDEQLVLMREYANAPEPELDNMLTLLSPATGLVIAEGYKRSIFPKIRVFRPPSGRPPLWPAIGGAVTVVADSPGAVQPPEGVTVLDLNDIGTVYRFAIQQLTKSVI